MQPKPKKDVQSMAEQARRLLAGKEQWRPGWMDWDIGGLRREREREGEGKVEGIEG